MRSALIVSALVSNVVCACGRTAEAPTPTPNRSAPVPTTARAPTSFSSPPPTDMPRPLWTEKVTSVERLPCDGAGSNGVHGIVKVSDGTALLGATVRIEVKGTPYSDTTTDKSGCYFVANLPHGHVRVYIVYANSEGSVPVDVPASGIARVDGMLEL